MDVGQHEPHQHDRCPEIDVNRTGKLVGRDGLDVATRRKFQAEVLGRVAEEGVPILLTSHEIAEAESSADRFVMLNGGKVSCNETIPDLLARHRIIAWDRGGPNPPAELDWVELPTASGSRALSRSWDEDRARSWLRAGGSEDRADLETVYLSLTGELEHA